MFYVIFIKIIWEVPDSTRQTCEVPREVLLGCENLVFVTGGCLLYPITGSRPLD